MVVRNLSELLTKHFNTNKNISYEPAFSMKKGNAKGIEYFFVTVSYVSRFKRPVLHHKTISYQIWFDRKSDKYNLHFVSI